MPFYADNPDDFLELVLSSSFTFPDSEWADVSEGRKLLPELSSQMLALDRRENLLCGACKGRGLFPVYVLTRAVRPCPLPSSVRSERLDQKDPRAGPKEAAHRSGNSRTPMARGKRPPPPLLLLPSCTSLIGEAYLLHSNLDSATRRMGY